MTQEEVINVLKKRKGWLFSAEIMGEIGADRSSVNRVLKILWKDGKVERKEGMIKQKNIVYLWRIKQKTNKNEKRNTKRKD